MVKTYCKEFTVKLPNNKIITAEMEVNVLREHSYGADAAGNRGVYAMFVEDVYPVVDINDPSWNVDDDMNVLTEDEKLEALNLLIIKAYKYDYDDMEGDSDEADYDCA